MPRQEPISTKALFSLSSPALIERLMHRAQQASDSSDIEEMALSQPRASEKAAKAKFIYE